MKITLIEKCGVSLKRGEDQLQKGRQWWGCGWSISFGDTTSPDLLNKRDKDFMEKNLVWSKITASRKISLAVYLLSKDGIKGKSVQVMGYEEDNRNIFKELRKTFGDKVTGSVCIKAYGHQVRSEEGNEQEIIAVSQEGLEIKDGKSGGDFFEGEAVSLPDFDPCEMRFDIKVIVDISDDHEVIRQAREKFSAPLKTTRMILEESLASDLTIIAGNGAEIKSHKNFLIASSPVIGRMFANKLEESKTGRVDMTDLSEEGVKAFLRFIYCGDKIEPEADLNLAFELLYASHKYEVSQLEEFMISYWMSIQDARIDVKSAFKTYMFVRGIEIASQLKLKMARILHRKHDELKVLPEYKDLCKTPMVVMELSEDLVTISNVKTQ